MNIVTFLAVQFIMPETRAVVLGLTYVTMITYILNVWSFVFSSPICRNDIFVLYHMSGYIPVFKSDF